jgi:hypothetical protein
MELAGDEKRIQALFSEVRLEHQRSAPQFVKVWNCAATTTPSRVPVFNRPVVMFGCVLILAAIGAFAWLSRDNATSANARDETIQPQVLATLVESPQKVQKRTPSQRVVHRKPARRLNIERTVVHNAAVLSKWQSPTDTLMKSSAASLLNALPALNESAKDLESYLSNNELKELKQ